MRVWERPGLHNQMFKTFFLETQWSWREWKNWERIKSPVKRNLPDLKNIKGLDTLKRKVHQSTTPPHFHESRRLWWPSQANSWLVIQFPAPREKAAPAPPSISDLNRACRHGKRDLSGTSQSIPRSPFLGTCVWPCWGRNTQPRPLTLAPVRIWKS